MSATTTMTTTTYVYLNVDDVLLPAEQMRKYEYACAMNLKPGEVLNLTACERRFRQANLVKPEGLDRALVLLRARLGDQPLRIHSRLPLFPTTALLRGLKIASFFDLGRSSFAESPADVAAKLANHARVIFIDANTNTDAVRALVDVVQKTRQFVQVQAVFVSNVAPLTRMSKVEEIMLRIA